MENWDKDNNNYYEYKYRYNKNDQEGEPNFIMVPEKKKKEKKPSKPLAITKKAFVFTLIICMLVTSALTVTGYTLAAKLGLSGTTKQVSATNYTLANATGSELSIEEIIAKNENAVVEIRTEAVTNDNWMQNYVTEGAGSGVIIDSNGYILTNNHVIEDASKITVTLKDETEFTATVVGTDSTNDVAVIKINGTGLTAATYGDSSKLSVGDLVVAIGNPLGELGGTATTGIISALDRELTIDNETLTLLQTDASINPGNSGGGLFDGYGNLVGLVVAKSSGSDVEGLGFAIPINQAASVAKQLIETGHADGKAIIGVSIQDVDDQTAMQYGYSTGGVFIAEVSSANATAAGFQVKDIIVGVDSYEITDSASLSAALKKYSPGDTVTVTVLRDNKKEKIKVTLTESSN